MNKINLELNKLKGDDLDKAVADALGWVLHTSSGPFPRSFYLGEDGAPISLNKWNPTQSARQAMRLQMDYQLSVSFNKNKNTWRALGYYNDEDTFSATGGRPHIAICRCIIGLRQNGAKPVIIDFQEKLPEQDKE